MLDKIAQVAPNAAISDGLATTAPAASPVALGASSKLVSSIAAGDAAGAAVAAGNAAPGANLIGAVACTVITPDSTTTPGAADGEITPGAAGPSHGAEATEVSELAGRAVYVLQCALICTQPRGSRALSFVRRLLLEQLYQPMWLVTTRFWQGIEAPGELCPVCVFASFVRYCIDCICTCACVCVCVLTVCVSTCDGQ